jgi:hypothetical protein
MQESLFDKDHLIAMQMNEGADLEWHMPAAYPDLTGYKQIAVDLETCDPNLTTLGPGWARKGRLHRGHRHRRRRRVVVFPDPPR